jgi:hypothetical protein
MIFHSYVSLPEGTVFFLLAFNRITSGICAYLTTNTGTLFLRLTHRKKGSTSPTKTNTGSKNQIWIFDLSNYLTIYLSIYLFQISSFLKKHGTAQQFPVLHIRTSTSTFWGTWGANFSIFQTQPSIMIL